MTDMLIGARLDQAMILLCAETGLTPNDIAKLSIGYLVGAIIADKGMPEVMDLLREIKQSLAEVMPTHAVPAKCSPQSASGMN